MAIYQQCLIALVLLLSTPAFVNCVQTSQPLFAILTQPLSVPDAEISESRPSEFSMSYIMKVYYQMLTSDGAMTIALPYDLPMRKMNDVLPFLSGVLIPDGYESTNKGKEFSTKLGFIMNWAKNRNKEGHYFALIAIGKGFQELMSSEIKNDQDFFDRETNNVRTHGKLIIDWVAYQSSSVFKKLQKSEVEYALTSENTVPFNHNWSIPVSKFQTSELSKEFNLIGTSTAKKGALSFVALVEHKVYPFVGMQFNPEVSAYVYNGGHSKDKRTIRFYRDLIVAYLFDQESENVTPLDELPLYVRNMLMYKDIPVRGLKDDDQIYLYRRWAAGRDIDLPN